MEFLARKRDTNTDKYQPRPGFPHSFEFEAGVLGRSMMNTRCCFLLGAMFAVQAASAVYYPTETYQDRCKCPDVVSEVCGNNDVTYKNICEFQCAVDKTPGLVLLHFGPCQLEFYDECECTEPYNPVCGSNGITYDNVCELNCEKNMHDNTLFIRFPGSCDSQMLGTPQYDILEGSLALDVLTSIMLDRFCRFAPPELWDFCNSVN